MKIFLFFLQVFLYENFNFHLSEYNDTLYCIIYTLNINIEYSYAFELHKNIDIIIISIFILL